MYSVVKVRMLLYTVFVGGSIPVYEHMLKRILTHASHYFPSTHFTILLIHITVVRLHQECGHWKVTSTSCQHQWGTTILRIGWDMVNTGYSQLPVTCCFVYSIIQIITHDMHGPALFESRNP